jgi:hypothetical protein
VSGGTHTAWDPLSVHTELARLSVMRAKFRMARMLQRIRSPRRIVATSLAVLFFLLYLLNGIFILSARQPADPERLRLWLSGGMAMYAIYHCLRCAWAKNITDLELTAAEKLWLGGAPVQRSSLAVYHVLSMMVPAMLKTLLLAVVLANDVRHLELLLTGIFSSLVLLETSRLIIARLISGMGRSGLQRFRVGITVIATAVGLQVIARLLSMTPAGSPTWMYLLNGFVCLGQTASCQTIQWLSLPWIASAHLAVTDHYQMITSLQLLASIAVLPLSILTLVGVDTWSQRKKEQRELVKLRSGDYQSAWGSSEQTPESTFAVGPFRWLERWIPVSGGDMAAVMMRQAVSIQRYWSTILFSFTIPTLLCLSPLMTGQVKEQWLFVIGGIGMCTMLLAPPALRIDFRRDLRRMLLLRLLPIRPLAMVLGQLTLPVLITCGFQWLTIAIAAVVTNPGWSQVLLWTGLLNALAVFTFAVENALFLAYPHHERSEGVAMMIRAKLTFLGKASVMALALGLLLAWAVACRQWFPQPLVITIYVGGAVSAAWLMAGLAIAITAKCWRRFDFASDTPPE